MSFPKRPQQTPRNKTLLKKKFSMEPIEPAVKKESVTSRFQIFIKHKTTRRANNFLSFFCDNHHTIKHAVIERSDFLIITKVFRIN